MPSDKLTREQLEAMPNAKLNEVVAESFGWRKIKVLHTGVYWWADTKRPKEHQLVWRVSKWSPADDLSSMGEVVAHMARQQDFVHIQISEAWPKQIWCARFNRRNAPQSKLVHNESIPRAVAIAAVLAVQQLAICEGGDV